jgi:DNA-damage-inducible protein J
MSYTSFIEEECLMSSVESVVRARIDAVTKAKASKALDAMGLNVSDAIRLLMVRIADDQRFPFYIKVPTAKSSAAIAELEAGKGHQAKDIQTLMAKLNADD